MPTDKRDEFLPNPEVSKGLEGSVFDTPADKLHRDILQGNISGSVGGMGVVANPNHWVHKIVQKYAPEIAETMKKAPGTIAYGDMPVSYFDRNAAFGTTTPVSKGAFVTVHPGLGGPLEQKLGHAGEDWAPATALHEAWGHALPIAETGGAMAMPYTQAQALQMLEQELGNPMQLHSKDYLMRLLKMYRGDAPHAAIETSVNNMVAPQGASPMIRDLSTYSPEQLKSVKHMLGF